MHGTSLVTLVGVSRDELLTRPPPPGTDLPRPSLNRRGEGSNNKIWRAVHNPDTATSILAKANARGLPPI